MALAPGSIAFTGFNADGNDSLAFVALAAIPGGTTIFFSDREWTGSAFNTGEGGLSWTAPAAGVPAGTIVTISDISDSDGVAISTNVGTAAGGSGLGADNEIVYAYLGTDADTPTVFLTAVANDIFTVDGATLAGTGLTQGVDALAFNGIDTDTDVAAFNGSRGGQADFAAYAPVINNAANWITQDGTGDQSADGTAPDAPFSTEAFTVGATGNEIGGIAILDQAESLQGSVAVPVATNALNVTRAGSYLSGDGEGGAESVAFDPTSDRAYVTNAAAERIDILDLSDPTDPVKVGQIDLASLPGYGNVNSVAVRDGLIAVAVQNADGGEVGLVALYDGAGSLIKTIAVGVLPDQLTFSPDGNLLLVANEAERFLDRSGPTPVVEDAPGTVTIIDVSGDPAAAAVRNTIGFSALDGDEAALEALGIRTYDGGTLATDEGDIVIPDSTVSQDIEPEYITVSPDGTRAYVTLQEVNAIAVIDLSDPSADRPVSILPAGAVDFSLSGNEADFSDRDGTGGTASISVGNSPVKSLLQPDAIASFAVGGVTYFVTANEGDSRILQDATLDDPALNEARASAVQSGAPADFARLNVDTVWSTSTDLYGFGGRGFSIFQQNADGTIAKVEETGGDFEQILAALPNAGTVFNGENGGGFDSRSDNKGAEPEGVAVGTVNGTPYVFVALERIGGVMVWDVSTPADAKFVQYIPPTADDFGPEVIKFVAAAESPTGRAMLITANEISGSVTTYDIGDPATTRIGAIQGSGHVSAMDGQTVITEGVVIAIDTNGSRGFYIQDPNGDGDAATSDAIFVFTNAAPTVTVGQHVRVTGVVDEFVANGAAPGSFSTTEIVATAAAGGIVTVLGAGPAVAPTVIGGEGGLLPPAGSLAEASAFYESLEGMLVTVKEGVVVGPTNDFGEIFAVVDNDADRGNGVNGAELNGRGALPIEAGAPDFGNTDLAGGDFNPERLQIDDDNGVFATASPSVSVGAELGDVTGIVRYDFGNYEIVPTASYAVDQQSALVKETTTLEGSASRLTVASYNAETFDPTDGAARFATIAQEIVTNLKLPDIITLQEVQDNDGPGNAAASTVTAANQTLQMLVDALNAAAPAGVEYAFIDNPFIGDDHNGGEGGGNIRTAFLYRTDRVDFVDGSLKTVAADGTAISDPAGNADQQTNPDNPFFDSRPPLIATFAFNGEDVTIVNNHFTSKGGSGALYGSDDTPLNAGEVQRAAQAQAVNNFVDSVLASDPDAKVLAAGDFNDFEFEEPLGVLAGTASISNYDVPAADPIAATATFTPGGSEVLHDLMLTLPTDERYDYVFEGNAQSLDHMLATGSLQEGAAFDVVRINAEFGDQTSDHDPLVASFEIQPSPDGDNVIHGTPDDDILDRHGGNDQLFGEAGDDQLDGGTGNDHLEGGTGDDRLAGGDGNDSLKGDDGLDVLSGGLGDDQLDGGDGNDVMFGDAGNDHLAGGQGDDVAKGGAGDDTFVVTSLSDGRDAYDGGAGVDTLDFSALVTPVNLDLSDGTTRLSTDTIVNVENLVGGAAGDRLGGNGLANVLSDGAGDDVLKGAGGDDRLEGGDGNDRLEGGADGDTLLGGQGNDDLAGGAGDDFLLGGAGADFLAGGGGLDQFAFETAGEGIDTITDFKLSGASRDTIVLSASMFEGFAGDDAFDLVGGGFLRAQSGGGQTQLQIDVDGGGNSFVTLATINGTLSNGVLVDHVELGPFA